MEYQLQHLAMPLFEARSSCISLRQRCKPHNYWSSRGPTKEGNNGHAEVLEGRGLWGLRKKFGHLQHSLNWIMTLTGLCLGCRIDNPKAKRVSNSECLLGGDCCAAAAQEGFKIYALACKGDAGHIFPKTYCAASTLLTRNATIYAPHQLIIFGYANTWH